MLQNAYWDHKLNIEKWTTIGVFNLHFSTIEFKKTTIWIIEFENLIADWVFIIPGIKKWLKISLAEMG